MSKTPLPANGIVFGETLHDPEHVAQFSDFKRGTHVRIKSGAFRGKTGTVVGEAPFDLVKVVTKGGFEVVLRADLEPLEKFEA